MVFGLEIKRDPFKKVFGNKFIQLQGDAVIQRRRLICLEQIVCNLCCQLSGVRCAGLAPALEVSPVREHRMVEGVLVPFNGMRTAEKVTARWNLANRVDSQLLG